MAKVIPLRARPSLSEFFVEHFEAEWPDWYGVGGKADARQDLTEFSNASGDLPVGVVALDQSDMPVGIAALKSTSISTHSQLSPWVVGGFVLPSYRRQGFGAALLGGIDLEAKRLGFKVIYCATASAVSLLERAGWKRIDAVNHDGGTQSIFERSVTVFP